MKTLPEQLKTKINIIYSKSEMGLHQGSTSLNGLFFVKVNIANGNIIPKVCSREYLRALHNLTSDTVIVPAVLADEAIIAKSSSDLLRKVFSCELYEDVSYKQVDFGDLKYYALPGIVFDKDKVPLLALAEEIQEAEINKPVKFSRPACIINPDVFNRSDKISKYIVQNVIPVLSNHIVVNRGRWWYTPEQRYTDTNEVKLIVDSGIKNFFYKPAAPKSLNPTEEIYPFLEKNIDEILNGFS